MPGIPRPHWTSPQLPSASSFCNTGANNDSHGSVGQGSSGYLTNRFAEIFLNSDKVKDIYKDKDIDFRSLPALVEVKVVDQEGARRLLSDFSLNNNDHSRNQAVQPSCQVVQVQHSCPGFFTGSRQKGNWTFFLPLPVDIFLQRLYMLSMCGDTSSDVRKVLYMAVF